MTLDSRDDKNDGEYSGVGFEEISGILLTKDGISFWNRTIWESDTAEGLEFPMSVPDYKLW